MLAEDEIKLMSSSINLIAYWTGLGESFNESMASLK